MKKSKTHKFCIDAEDVITGARGAFVYLKAAPLMAVSPVFDKCADLFKWMNKNNMTTGGLGNFSVYDIKEEMTTAHERWILDMQSEEQDKGEKNRGERYEN